MTQEKLVLFLQRTAHLTAGQALAIAADFESLSLRKHGFLLQAGTISDGLRYARLASPKT